ncbi:WD40 repeat-like protein [Clavulina sp. PMI_390]|nr:WD40 repeat-like protein [Clavulina sp. PMI_390]
MVAPTGGNARKPRSRTGTPNPPAAASTSASTAETSRRSYSTRGAQKAVSSPQTPVAPESTEPEASEDDDEQETQQATSSKDATSDPEDASQLRRASTRIAAKAAAREIAAQTAPSPPQAAKKLPKSGSTGAPRGESTGSADVVEVLVTDPNDMLAGYKQLEEWIYGGLDMYRPEFHPLLFPVFCHFYIELISQGFKESGLQFYEEHADPLREQHANDIHHLSSLLLPSHVAMSSFAQRLRSEKYVLRMSRAGFALFVGWLTEGTGGEGMGSGEGIMTGREGAGRRARFTVLKIVHGSLKFDVTNANTNAVKPETWEEQTGLISSLIPPPATGTRLVNGKQVSGPFPGSGNPAGFNAYQGDLKLGPAPLSEALRDEAERQIKEEDEGMNIDAPPVMTDLLPQPTLFRAVDVKREVERVRDARKRIRLDPSVLYEGGGSAYAETNGYASKPTTTKLQSSALPSICAYTFHDAQDGVNCSTFSDDSTMMAAGFNESYIRIWSLKKEKLKAYQSHGFDLSHVSNWDNPAHELRRYREKHASSTRKLIGHSSPVFATAFDSVAGTSAPPKFLLSASADHTTRLWSLETMSNIVAYRGHKNPVWDVQWSPTGTYFATASRDRTARLWSSERINALRVFAGHLSDVDCVRFHPNSLYLATGSSDMTCPTDLSINLWDLGSGRKIKTMTGHTAPINSLSFSACTTMLISGSSDWTVRCWDVKASGGPPAQPQRLNGALPDGAIDDKDVKVESVDLLQTFHTKRTSVIDVRVTPRNLVLVAGSYIPKEASS